jgi:sugar diacid utilization regulator
MEETPPGPPETVAQLRSHVSSLVSIFALSMTMFDRRDEREILDMAAAAVATIGPYRAEAGFLTLDEGLTQYPYSPSGLVAGLTGQVEHLMGGDGTVILAGRPWARAFALHGLRGNGGHLVVSADAEPSADETFLLKVLLQQAAAAITGALLYQRALQHTAELQSLNQRLAVYVSDLEHRARHREVLLRASVAGLCEEGLAGAVHELTGFPVAIEDAFGNLRAWAGPGRPDPYPRPDRRRRSQLLSRARSALGPLRERDRLLALAQPRGDILGVVALVDPDRSAGPLEAFTIEQAAMVLATELAHQRSLAEMELRMRRDLVDDLCSGTEDETSVLARAEALGHDLRPPHQVVMLEWQGTAGEILVRAVARVGSAMELGSLVGRRRSRVVLLAQLPGLGNGVERWAELHRTVGRELGSATGAAGVGGRADAVGDLPRSCEEARRALEIRKASQQPFGVTVFEDLGIYRLLAAGGQTAEIDRFVREWLGALLDYDAGHRSDLVSTLSRYLESGGNYDRAAEALDIHRSTLRYRLQRIREITGRDITDVDVSFHLHAATRAWQVRRGSA